MRFHGRRARISVLISLALLVLLLIPVVDQFVFRYGWAAAALEDIEGRHARLLGLRDAAEPIEQALATSSELLARHAYPVDTGADRVGADLQQRVRQIAEAAGVGVVGSQILPVTPGAGFEVIPLNMTADADIGALREFLASLGREQPSIQLDSLNLSAPRQRRSAASTDANVRAQIRISVIHLLP